MAEAAATRNLGEDANAAAAHNLCEDANTTAAKNLGDVTLVLLACLARRTDSTDSFCVEL